LQPREEQKEGSSHGRLRPRGARTHHLWNGVREALGRDDTIALACPGFGNPRPAGFAATKEAYVDWLVAELEKIGEPVDLVGHDWGGAFTLRVASIRPDLLR